MSDVQRPKMVMSKGVFSTSVKADVNKLSKNDKFQEQNVKYINNILHCENFLIGCVQKS